MDGADEHQLAVIDWRLKFLQNFVDWTSTFPRHPIKPDIGRKRGVIVRKYFTIRPLLFLAASADFGYAWIVSTTMSGFLPIYVSADHTKVSFQNDGKMSWLIQIPTFSSSSSTTSSGLSFVASECPMFRFLALGQLQLYCWLNWPALSIVLHIFPQMFLLRQNKDRQAQINVGLLLTRPPNAKMRTVCFFFTWILVDDF